MTYRADLAKQLWDEIQEAPGKNTKKAWETLDKERITSTYKTELNKSMVDRGRFLENGKMQKDGLKDYADLEKIQAKSGVKLLKENMLKLLHSRIDSIHPKEFMELNKYLVENTSLTINRLLHGLPDGTEMVFFTLIKGALDNPGKYEEVSFDDKTIKKIVLACLRNGENEYEITVHSLVYHIAETTSDQEIIQAIYASDKGINRWGREKLCYNSNTPVDILKSIYSQVLDDRGNKISNSVLEGLSYEKRKAKRS